MAAWTLPKRVPEWCDFLTTVLDRRRMTRRRSAMDPKSRRRESTTTPRRDLRDLSFCMDMFGSRSVGW